MIRQQHPADALASDSLEEKQLVEGAMRSSMEQPVNWTFGDSRVVTC